MTSKRLCVISILVGLLFFLALTGCQLADAAAPDEAEFNEVSADRLGDDAQEEAEEEASEPESGYYIFYIYVE